MECKTLQIALDARTVYASTRRGTGKCFAEVYHRAAALRPDSVFLMLHRGGTVADPFEGISNIRRWPIEIKGDRWNLWQKVRLPWAARRAGADVLHCPANTGPAHPLAPMLLTVHDLIPLEPAFATTSARP